MTDLADFMLGEQSQARAAVSGAFDSNPDDAARSLELSQASGVPAPAIHMDLEHFDRIYKNSLASELLDNNEHLRNYVNSHPLAAAVSHDDLGQLDKVSEALANFGGKSNVDNLTEMVKNLEDAREAHQKGEGFDIDYLSRQTYSNFMQGLIGMPGGLGATGDMIERAAGYVAGAVGGPKAAEVTKKGLETVAKAQGLNWLPKPEHFIKPVEKYLLGPLPTEDPDKWVQNIIAAGLGFAEFGPEAAVGGAVGKVAETALKGTDFEELGNVIGMLVGGIGAHYVRAGISPPHGTDPRVDKLYEIQAKIDAKNLDEIQKEIDASATKGRSEEMAANYVREHPAGTVNIEVPAEAIRKLYGDTEPMADDNKLGFVENLQEQLMYAEQVGGDVTIPLADWLTKVSPEVAEALHDDLRLRPNGLTLNEAKELPKAEEPKEEPSTELVPAKEEERLPGEDPIQDVADNIRATNGWDYAEGRDLEPAMGAYPLQEPKDVTLHGGVGKVRSVGSTTVRDALNSLNLNLIEDKAKGVHANNLREITRLIVSAAGDVPIHIVNDAEFNASVSKPAGAYYQQALHHIVVSESHYYHPDLEAWNTASILHEAVHAATVRAIDSTPELKARIRSIMDHVKDQIPDIQADYGYTNEKEFLAEALSNPKFQAKLISTRIAPDFARRLDIPNWRNTSVFQGISHFLRFFLRVPKDAATAFEATLQATEQATKTPIPEGYRNQIKQYRRELGVEPTKSPLEGEEAAKKPEPPPFEGRAIGLTAKQMSKLRELIAKRDAEDRESQLERAKKLEEKRQTKEWRENEKRVRGEVRRDINARPDIAAATFFRGKTGPKLNPDFLDDQQRMSLPKEMLSKSKGVDPDQFAREFSYQSGDEMIERLGRLEQEKGDQPLETYVSQLVRDETDKRMRYQYGDLGENILEEAQDHVLGVTQMELLHEMTMQMATAAGVEPKLADGSALTKENVARIVKQSFNGSKVGAVTVEKYLRNAGKHGRLAETVNDPVEALKHQQQQYLQAALAREALKFQKEQKQLQRTAKTYSKAEVAGIAPQFLNYVHDIMTRTGMFVNRSLEHIQQGIEMHRYGSLEDFYQYQNEVGLPESYKEYDVTYTPRMPIAEMLFDENFRKPIDQMSVGEFRAVHNSLKALIKIGRDEAKINREGATEDRNIVIGKMIEQLKIQGEKPIYYPEQAGVFSKFHHFGQRMFAGLLQLEALWDRLDRADPEGIFTKWIGRPFAKAGNEFSALQREFSRELAKLEQPKNLGKLIPNDLFVEPLTWDTGNERFRPMTRENLLTVMLNMGNPSNLDILSRGHRVDKAQLIDWVTQHATKEDLAYVQGMWDIYKKIKAKEDRMTEHLSGTTIEDIPIHQIETQFGTYDGGYFPVKPDRTNLLEGEKKVLENTSMYLRPATSKGWEIKRSGWAGPLDLSLSGIPQDISRRLKDLAFREVISNAAKIMTDRSFRAAMTKYYGQQYTDLLLPYLRDMAGQVGITPANTQAAVRAIEGARLHTVATLVGFNIGTFLKHTPTAMANSIGEIGLLRFGEWMLKTWADPTMNNYRWVMQGGKIGNLDWGGSQEVQRRMQHFEETLGGVNDFIMGKPTFRQRVMQWGSKLVAMGDLASAIPNWYGIYVPEMKKLMTTMPIEEAHTIAEELADRSLRFAHGSTAVTSRPEYARGGVAARGALSLYGIFNHIMNRNYAMGWRAKDMATGKSPHPVASDLAELTNKFLWYSVVPIVGTQIASMGLHKEGEPWWKSALHVFGGQLPIIREFTSAFGSGHDPSVGIWGATYKAVNDMGRDIIKIAQGKGDAGSALEHAITMSGIATGVGSEQVGKWAKFIYNYNMGKERPRTSGDWWRAFRRGTIKEIK